MGMQARHRINNDPTHFPGSMARRFKAPSEIIEATEATKTAPATENVTGATEAMTSHELRSPVSPGSASRSYDVHSSAGGARLEARRERPES